MPEARGAGAADRIMAALVEQAGGCVRQLLLTVIADNARARLPRTLGFSTYAIEPASVRRGEAYADEASMWRPL